MINNEKLNNTAMQIILAAGNGREKVHSAIRISIDDVDGSKKDQVSNLLQEAKVEINTAHRVQTEIMQAYIEEELFITILFAHAQDTLMTVLAEYNMAGYIIETNYKILGGT